MARFGKKLAFLAFLGGIIHAEAWALADGPVSVLGRDFCADQLVLAFADDKQIVAVSEDAAGLHSYFANRANGIVTTKGSAEEILSLRPDLVMRSWRGSLATDALFARAGIDTYQPPYAFTFDMALDNFKAAANRLGKSEEGEAFVADYSARYEALQRALPIPLKAVYLTPSGYTAGKNTSADDVIRLAGFTPAAGEYDVTGWAPLPLEKLVLSPPEVVIGSFFEEGAVHVSHWSGGRHGAFRGLVNDLPSIMIPSRFMSCSGPFAVDAAEFVRAEARRLGLIPSPKHEALE